MTTALLRCHVPCTLLLSSDKMIGRNNTIVLKYCRRLLTLFLTLTTTWILKEIERKGVHILRLVYSFYIFLPVAMLEYISLVSFCISPNIIYHWANSVACDSIECGRKVAI